MAEFVLSEAEVENSVCHDISILSQERKSDREFIDDAEYGENVENYWAFDNISRDYDDAINDSLSGFDFSQGATNYCSDNEIEEAIVKTLVNPHGDDNSDSFFFCDFICNLLSVNWKNKRVWVWERVKKWYQQDRSLWIIFDKG